VGILCIYPVNRTDAFVGAPGSTDQRRRPGERWRGRNQNTEIKAVQYLRNVSRQI